MTLQDETRLDALIDDSAAATAAGTAGPPDILGHADLIEALGRAEGALPPRYRRAVHDPLVGTLTRIGKPGWDGVLRRDPQRQGIALLGLDLTQSVLQRADGTFGAATHAMQEVVSDLYDGFLSAADRHGVEPPDHGVIPPLVKWGRPTFGPYAWPVTAAGAYGCEAGIVNMPPAFTAAGLAAWSALGHETAGHHILHADDGLHDALAAAVMARLAPAADAADTDDTRRQRHLATYWAARIDETASDLMGIVNMGPAAAVGLIAYFRALGLVFRGDGRLSTNGPATAVHPAGLARGYLMAAGLGLCSFPEAAEWARRIAEEVDRDAPSSTNVTLAGMPFTPEQVKDSARDVAEAVLATPVAPLEHRRLLDIQDWRPFDERVTRLLAVHAIIGSAELPAEAHHAIFAAHGVAAAIIAALVTGDTARAQARMVRMVAAMHGTNPIWSALEIPHPGDVAPHSFLPDFAREPGLPSGQPGIPRPAAFGGDVVPFFLGTVPPPARLGENVPWFLSQAGLAVDGKTGSWTRAQEAGEYGSGLDQRLSPEILKLLLGQPDVTLSR